MGVPLAFLSYTDQWILEVTLLKLGAGFAIQNLHLG